jgi:hypothetical protein
MAITGFEMASMHSSLLSFRTFASPSPGEPDGSVLRAADTRFVEKVLNGCPDSLCDKLSPHRSLQDQGIH